MPRRGGEQVAEAAWHVLAYLSAVPCRFLLGIFVKLYNLCTDMI